MDGTPPAPEGKKRVIKEKITTTTERTVVEDLEVTAAPLLGMYIMNIILRFRKLRLVCPVPGSLKFPYYVHVLMKAKHYRAIG